MSEPSRWQSTSVLPKMPLLPLTRISSISRRRHLLILGMSLVTPLKAQPNLDAIETASSLDQLLTLLQAQAALPSTRLLLDAPDIAAPGPLRIRLHSELPGTALMVLVRGRFSPQVSQSGGPSGVPPISTRRSLGEYQPKDRLPRPVWLATFPIRAGQPASATLKLDIDTSQTLSLFVHAQGRWWFVSRDIKVGRPR